MTSAFLTKYHQLLSATLAVIALPFGLYLLGLSLNTGTMVVALAIAAMGLNLCIGYTGLVSFGHGAWFGLAAYAAALLQRNWMHDSFFGHTVAGVVIVAAVAAAFGFLILRRRGVYFSLLTLALAAMLVGVVRGITIHFAPAAGEASIYVLMFLVLLVRPRGLLGERIEKFE